MATIINNPGSSGTESESSSLGWVMVLLVVILFFVFLIFGLPRMRGGQAPANTSTESNQQEAPEAQSESGIQVDIPEQVDVNINQNP